jgi:hypothetical protein
MNKPLAALAAFTALTAAVPAAAQFRSPSSSSFEGVGTQAAKLIPNRDTAESMKSYGKVLEHAECLVSRGHSAEGVLVDKPNSRSERSKTALLRERDRVCLMKVENIHSIVRGALAEAMYRRNFPQMPAMNAARAQAFINAEKAFQAEREKNDQLMGTVMTCMVAVAPQQAHAILATTHGTAQEATAMDAFFVASQKCGAGATRPSNLSRSFIRAFVADSAWRFARAISGR